VLTSLLSAAAPTMGALVAIRFVSGLAAALAFVVARAMVADVYPGVGAARAYALLGSITGIAPVVAPIAGGLLALVMGWRGIFVVLAGIGAVIGIVAWLRVPETMPAHARQQSGVSHGVRDLVSCLRSRAFMTYVACTAMAGGVLFTYISSSPFVLQEGYGLTPTAYSAVFAMNSVGIFIVALIGRRLVSRLGPARMLWSGQVIAVTGSAIVLAGLLSDLLPIILAGLLIAISSIGLVFANSLALGIRASPVRAGSASALLGISGFLVGGLLAPLGGLGGAAMGMLMLVFAGIGLVLHRALRVPSLEVT
jgi:DHA1 family bicyclomycin/chloramphenicol resistance-like MFS transporter